METIKSTPSKSQNKAISPKRPSKHSMKGKLRRPLSAYNIYFRSERERIRQVIKDGCPSEDYAKNVESALRRLKGKKGAAEFQAVASTIATRWKALPEEERTKYEKLAEGEMEQYKERKFEYHRTLVRECEDAARVMKAPDVASPAGNPTDHAKLDAVPSVLAVPGYNQDHMKYLPERAPTSAVTVSTTLFPGMVSASYRDYLTLPPAQRDGPMSFLPRSKIAAGHNLAPFVGGHNFTSHPFASTLHLQQQNHKLNEYEDRILSLRRQVLEEHLFLQAQQERKRLMERQVAVMEEQNAMQQEGRQLWQRHLAYSYMGNHSSASRNTNVSGGAVDRQAELAAILRASLEESS